MDYLRTLEKKEGRAFIHWWYYPDSYDTWMSATDVEGEDPEIPTKHIGPWRVVRYP